MAVAALALAILYGILERAKKGIILDLGTELLKAVDAAESQWTESGQGKRKKKWAVGVIMAWIKQHVSLSWWQRWLVSIAVGNLVDAVIDEVNQTVGRDWRDAAEKRLEELTGVDLPDGETA